MNNYEAALHYAEQGWPVLPLRDKDKRPAINGWPELASKDPEQISQWFDKASHNIGLLTGDGLLCLDVDLKPDQGKDGQAKLKAMAEELGELPCTVTATTPSGGLHLLFQYDCSRYPIGRHVAKQPDSEWFGVDILGNNSQIAVQPSCTASGCYLWKAGELPSLNDVAQLPEAWCRKLLEVTTRGGSAETTTGGGSISAKSLAASLPEEDHSSQYLTEPELEHIRKALSWLPASGWSLDHSWNNTIKALKLRSNSRPMLKLAMEWSAAKDLNGNHCQQFQSFDDVATTWNRGADATEEDWLHLFTISSMFHHAQLAGFNQHKPLYKHTVITKDGEATHPLLCVNAEDMSKPSGTYTEQADGSYKFQSDLISEITDNNNSQPPTEEAETPQPERPSPLEPLQVGVRYDRRANIMENYLQLDDIFNITPEQFMEKPPEFPLDIVASSGLLRDLVDLNLLKAYRPQLESSVMGSLVLMCTMLEGMFKSNLGDWMRLSTVNIAETGAGKDAMLATCMEVLEMTGNSERIMSAVHSETGYKQELTRVMQDTGRACGLYVQDEFGVIKASKEDKHNLSGFWLELSGSAAGRSISGTRLTRGQGSVESISHPHLQEISATTGASLQDFISDEASQYGILNRILWSQSPKQKKTDSLTMAAHMRDSKVIKSSIKSHHEMIQRIIRLENTSGGIPSLNEDCRVELVFTDEAIPLVDKLADHFEEEELNNGSQNPFYNSLQFYGVEDIWNRFQQQAKVVACVIALSELLNQLSRDAQPLEQLEALKEPLTVPVRPEHVMAGARLAMYSCCTVSRLFTNRTRGKLDEFRQKLLHHLLMFGGSTTAGKLRSKVLRSFKVERRGDDLFSMAVETLTGEGELIEQESARGSALLTSVSAIKEVCKQLHRIWPDKDLNEEEALKLITSKAKLHPYRENLRKTKQPAKQVAELVLEMARQDHELVPLHYDQELASFSLLEPLAA